MELRAVFKEQGIGLPVIFGHAAVRCMTAMKAGVDYPEGPIEPRTLLSAMDLLGEKQGTGRGQSGSNGLKTAFRLLSRREQVQTQQLDCRNAVCKPRRLT